MPRGSASQQELTANFAKIETWRQPQPRPVSLLLAKGVNEAKLNIFQHLWLMIRLNWVEGISSQNPAQVGRWYWWKPIYIRNLEGTFKPCPIIAAGQCVILYLDVISFPISTAISSLYLSLHQATPTFSLSFFFYRDFYLIPAVLLQLP